MIKFYQLRYTRLGQLESKTLGDNLASLKYEYAKDGMITARTVNGARQAYEYDKKGQLLAMKDSSGKAVEAYVYDVAGNILKKTVDGKITQFDYDAANQLVKAYLPDGTVKDYAYDAAGRMTQEGNKTYNYGWLNKVMSITAGDKTVAEYDYTIEGQVAKSNVNGKQETLVWDDLALVQRDGIELTNEPYVTGGNPVMTDGKVMFNDILGSTLGVATDGKFNPINRTSFGEPLANGAHNDYNFFTGKPQIEGLGYAFLFRNYNANNGKWLTSDPLGYPDGWNNFAYVNNQIIGAIDRFGTDIYHVVDPNGAVFGAGHSAWIIGNDTAGYTTYDYRPEGSESSSGSNSPGGSPQSNTFNNVADAIDYLNNGRMDGHKYTDGQAITTSAADDQIAKWSAALYMAEDYSLTGHNCYQLGNRIIADVNRNNGTNYQISGYIQPNNAFSQNQTRGWQPVAMSE